jgi:polyribonucleotide nucleotidyltransferase
VKVLAIEGNRIKLSRKAVLREQRAKLGLPEPGQIGTDGASVVAGGQGRQEVAGSDIAGGDDDAEDFDDDGDESAEEPNFNRAEGAVPVQAGGAPGSNGPGGQRRPGGGRRRRGGRRPGGSGSGSGAPSGGGNR